MNPRQDDRPTPPTDHTAGLSPSTAAAVAIGTTFGRYRDLQVLGAGGMGTVFRAYDPTLGRLVALKLIRGPDPALAQRLLLEARAQARIGHEHVCEIYEAGEEDGRPYIAMRFVNGASLKEIAHTLTLEQKLKLMAEVAEALHAAHRVGLLHRDVKPSNVMVEQGEDGGAIPYVVDFGLAFDVDTPGVTVSGMALGTPWYMSPEQARGGHKLLDRRSDVYSIGATLYDLLAGVPPFEGDSGVDVMMRVLSEEPVPLGQREPGIPRDVQTIVMKCLEKDPQRRYDSARALAEDIRRYLDGEPIAGRPTTAFYRVYKRARKHRAVVAVSAGALVLVAVFAALALSERASARKQVALAAEFARTVEDAEGLMRVAHMAPLHDIRAEKARVREHLVRIEQRMAEAGSVARGPGDYALGRGRLALDDPKRARQHLEAAWAAGYRSPEVAYALGLALGTLYQGELVLADAIGPPLREAKRREIQAAYRDPAIAYLQKSAGSATAVPEYVEGLLAFYEKRHADAMAKADAALLRAPWLYEAHLLKGDVLSQLSRVRHETGDAQGSLAAIAEAESAYRAAATFARSEPLALLGVCQLGIQRMEVTLFARGDLAPLYRTVRADCEAVLQADPDHAEAHAKLANIHRYWVNHLRFLRQDPVAALDLARKHAERAIAIDPGNRRAHGNLGILSRMLAEHETNQGRDGSAALRQAFTSLQKAVELSGGDASSLNDLGNAHWTRARGVAKAGGDPREDLSQAITLYGRALERVPDFGYSHANRGSAYIDLARYEMDHGHDPAASVRGAISSLERSVALLPHLEGTHTLLADAHALVARVALRAGSDPGPSIAAARRELAAALAINPKPDAGVLAQSRELGEMEAEWEQKARVSSTR
jgi:eukaryotic-like serine/threonine-protein kinase